MMDFNFGFDECAIFSNLFTMQNSDLKLRCKRTFLTGTILCEKSAISKKQEVKELMCLFLDIYSTIFYFGMNSEC